MTSKFSITNISNDLADDKFRTLCTILNDDIYTCLDEAWDDEILSKTRKERIKNKFADAMMKRSEENGI